MSATIRRLLAGSTVVAILLWVGVAWSVPTSITHQGRLLKKSGQPMTGKVTLKFTIYDSKTGGSIIWQSSAKQVDVGSSGFYSVTLGGSQNPIDSTKLKGGQLWVGLQVNGNAELQPRLPIRSVPYAIRSGEADGVADGAVGTNDLQNGAVKGQKIASVDWSKIQSKPQGLDDGDDDTLGSLQCTTSQVAKYDGNQWTCGSAGTTYSAGDGLNLQGSTFNVNDMSCPGSDVATGIQNGSLQCTSSSSGDITEVSAGTGLSGGGQSGSVTVSADYTEIQQRVSGSCSSGKFVTSINQDGTVNCASPSSSSGCSGKTFEKANICPSSTNSASVPCDEVPLGSFCEFDTSSNCGLDNSINNCGSYDWYIRTD